MSEPGEPGSAQSRPQRPRDPNGAAPESHLRLNNAQDEQDEQDESPSDREEQEQTPSTADRRAPDTPSESVVPPEKNEIEIGLWGATGSGKTTYLAALSHAINDASCGSWNVFPLSPDSSKRLYTLSQYLNKGQFPPSTPPGNSSRLHWRFHGDVANTSLDPRHRLLRRRGPADIRFALDLLDVPGAAYKADYSGDGVSATVAGDALVRLSRADGILYLFDPIRERDRKDSADYMNWTITELKRLYTKAGGQNRNLEQYLSVCITKFDHPDVFQEARANGWVETGPNGLPRVSNKNARKMFIQLCTGKFWGDKYEQSERSAQFILGGLQSAFGQRKIEYFVTSSIGFYEPLPWSDAMSGFDPDDFANYRPGDEASKTPASIRGAIRPINVLEPLISLQQRVAAKRGA
jgi:hypothetical protein